MLSPLSSSRPRHISIVPTGHRPATIIVCHSLSFAARPSSMLFSSRLSLSVLIELCRALRHYLGAGLTLRDVFQQQSVRGPAALRPVAGRIADLLKRGSSLENALEREKKY